MIIFHQSKMWFRNPQLIIMENVERKCTVYNWGGLKLLLKCKDFSLAAMLLNRT